MSAEWDVVVAGAGHNSLTAAAYLAKAGFRCLVLEARDRVGGDTSSEEISLPGYVHDTCSTAHNLIQASPMLRDRELPLDEYGLEYLHPDPVVHVPFPDGAWLTQWRDPERTREEFARFSRRDADAFERAMHGYDSVAPLFGRYRHTPIGKGPRLDELLAGHPDGGHWLRRQAMSAWDVVSDAFEDEHTRAFMLWMAFMTVQPVDRPGTGVLAYSLLFGRQRHSWTLPRGGSGALPAALARFIEAHGGTILTGRRVAGLVLEGGRCVGVETDRGERHLAARAVLSTVHVKHLVEMAPPGAWGDDFVFGVQTWRPGISMFVTHYATTEPPRYPVDGGTVESVASGIPSASAVARTIALGSGSSAATASANQRSNCSTQPPARSSSRRPRPP